MSKRVKHSKIKNTGILFELLSRQITQDIISDDKKSKSIDLLKKYFNENTEIGKESRSKINNKKLKNEKYNLIKSISENYKTEDFFRSRIPNYKVYASVYKLFLSESIESLNPLDEVDSNFTIIEHITGKKIPSSVKDDTEVIKEFKGQDKDLRLLSYQLMVDNFNKKYKTLNTPQKNLLKEYINNISNTNSLREFVNDEVQNIKTTLESHVPNISDDITRIKLQEAVNQIENLTKGRIVKDKQVISLMRYYELIKELDNVRSK